MDTLINYLIESGVSLGLLTLIYFLLLRKETFFKLNRYYLLLAVIFSTVLPFVQYNIVSNATPFVLLDGVQVNANNGFSNIIETVNVYGTGYSSLIGQFIGSLSVVTWFLGIGILLSIIMLVSKLLKLNGLFRKGNVSNENGYVHIRLKGAVKPFSFFNLIFTGDNYTKDNQQNNQIILHELAHVKQLHSVDILIVELLTILQWWNPFLWVLKSAIRENHEYLADRAVIDSGYSKAGYKQLLLQQGLGLHPEIVNNLNVNMIKKRFKMMSKMKSHKISIVKYVAGILTCSILFVAFTGSSKSIQGLSTLGKAAEEEHSFVLVDKDLDAEKSVLFEGELYTSRELAKMDLEEYRIENISSDEVHEMYPDLDLGSNNDVAIANKEISESQKEDQVFVVVEKMPEFPGGVEGMKKWLSENIKYPDKAKKQGESGTVYVSFVVNKKGKVVDAEIARGEYDILNKEALRVINSMPKWQPGEQRDKKVAVKYTVPINFSLGEDKKEDGADDVFVIVEEMPEFPGGQEAVRKFIGDNVKYPKLAVEKGIQGKVYVSFVVSKEGSVKDVKVARSVDPILDEEAMRVVSSMDKWKPGKQRGKNVNVQFTIPVNFALSAKDEVLNQIEKLSIVESDATIIEDDCPVGKPNENGVYVIVEEMPKFPGGEEALRKYIGNNVKYPKPAAENGIQGRVYVTFVVQKDGSVADAKIARGVDPILDEEAIRVVSSLPKWKPGAEKGKPVKVAYTVPITFSLGEGDETKKNDTFVIVEKMPEFPDGEEAFRNFITSNVKYPVEAAKKGIAGRVYVSFVIDEEGDVINVRIARGVDPMLDEEAMRVVASSPKWTPGEQEGKKVKVNYTVPVTFNLK